jgi:hypothetical protein
MLKQYANATDFLAMKFTKVQLVEYNSLMLYLQDKGIIFPQYLALDFGNDYHLETLIKSNVVEINSILRLYGIQGTLRFVEMPSEARIV